MDTTSIASVASALSNARLQNEASVLVLKKAIDAQAQSAQQLIDALPEVQAVNPAHLGNSVDLFA